MAVDIKKLIMSYKCDRGNLDVLIINSETDSEDALKFKEMLEKNIFAYMGMCALPLRVCLFQHINNGSPFSLDDAFDRSLFIFLYITKTFSTEMKTLFHGHVCLQQAIETNTWRVIPIMMREEKSIIRLPMSLKTLQPIYIQRGQITNLSWIDSVLVLLKHHRYEYIKRELEWIQKMEKDFEEMKTDELESLMIQLSFSGPDPNCCGMVLSQQCADLRTRTVSLDCISSAICHIPADHASSHAEQKSGENSKSQFSQELLSSRHQTVEPTHLDPATDSSKKLPEVHNHYYIINCIEATNVCAGEGQMIINNCVTETDELNSNSLMGES